LRESSPFEDLDFTFEKFKKRYNSDLAAGIGNLVARIIGMSKRLKVKKTKKRIENFELREEVEKTNQKWKTSLEEFKFNEALISIWDLISFCDKFIQEKKPWEKKEKKVISDLLLTLGEISKMLYPFFPETSERILKQIETKKMRPLFPRI
jgi:methionyl-tRNA synthetase